MLETKPVNPDVLGFLTKFEKAAQEFVWFELDGCKIRTRIEGKLCCPLEAYAYYRSHAVPADRFFSEYRHLGSVLRMHDRTVAAIVHNADCIRSSRYFDMDVRKAMELMCKIGIENATSK